MDDSWYPRYPVGSAGSVLLILNMLAEDGYVRVSQVSQDLGIGKSTAHRLLSMLKAQGFAIQDPRRAYRPGPALERIARSMSQSTELTSLARPQLIKLAERVDATAHLMVLVGNGARFVESVEPASVHLGIRTGMLLPAHVVSGGKALLAQLSPQQLWSLYPRGVPATRLVGERTVPALVKELAGVRRRGYATNRQESTPGLVAVGVNIPHTRARPRVGMALAFPPERASEDLIEYAAEELVKSSAWLATIL